MTPDYFFFLEFIHQWTSFYHFRKKKYYFFLYCARECKGNDVHMIIWPRFYLSDTRAQLWKCCNIYESPVSITSPLKTITDPLKEIKMVKTDPKKVPSQLSLLLVPQGTIAQLFTKKNLLLHNPFMIDIFVAYVLFL